MHDINSGTILITGASGSLGSQILYELADQGLKPIAHVRPSSDTVFIDSLKLEKRTADFLIRPELAQLVAGVDYVIHTAAWVDFRANRLTQFAAINTIGAVDLYRAAAAAGVKRFVHISTVAAVGALPRGNSADKMGPSLRRLTETWEYNLDHLRIPYIMTKRAAEIELLKAAAEGGPELVIVNPSIILAPSMEGREHDRNRARQYARRFLAPDYSNRINLVDVRDVARGVLSALAKGRPGERYILGGDNISVRELMLALSLYLGREPHLVCPPRSLVNAAARLSLWWGKVTARSRIGFYPDLVRMIDYDWAFGSAKARQELGYRSRSVLASLKDLLTGEFKGSYARR